MNGIPPAAIAVIAAALDDYRLTTPVDTQTPHAAAQRTAEYLLSSGWTINIPTNPRPRATCPECTARHLITTDGHIRRHGPHANPCPGGGTPAHTPNQPERRPA
jgi:hypothetical protein